MHAPEVDLKNLVNNLKVGVYRRTAGINGRFLFVNAILTKILGYTADELLKMPVSDLFEDRRKYRSSNDRTCHDGHVQDEEIKLKRKDKKVIWCSVTAVVVKDKQGKIKWIDGIIKDISVHKRMEKDLLESRELFRTVFDNSAVAITVTDKDEKIIAWNPFAEKMLGMHKEDLFNKPVKDLYPPREWRRMRSFRIRRKGMLSDIETQIYRSDRSILDVNASISVLKDIDGNVIGAIGIISDITKQKAAERKIKESENKIRVILDNSAAGITLTDQHERIISWNSFTEHLLGMKRKDLYLKPVSLLYPIEEWLKIRAENIRQKGSKHHMQSRVIRKDGKIIDIDLSVNVLKDVNNKIIGSVGIMQDIAEHKKVQEVLLQAKLAAEEANSSKSLFLANMSHEVRTPMSTILGMLDLTLDTALTPEQKENLKVTKEAAESLLRLLNDILDLSRAEAGKIALESIEFNLRNVIESLCKGLAVLAHKKKLELKLIVDPGVPALLIGDPVRLRQILTNLINNAIKFTHQGKIETKVRAASVSAQACELIFSVSDTGIGIPKDKYESIFEVFTQADASTTRRYGGTGLGLAICKRLVEMMGGHIWVTSKECEGSIFYFTCSYKIAEGKTEPLQTQIDFKADDIKIDRGSRKFKILLAEDNLVNQKITVKLLEKQGWQVETVLNGEEVLDRLNKDTFDLILMDTHMPVLDGIATTKLIREDELKTGRHMPIVALTARAMEEDKQKCLESGMDEYVPKPIDRNRLFEVIENICLRKKG